MSKKIKGLSVLLISSLILSFVLLSSFKVAEGEDNKNAPHIEFEELVHDYGTVAWKGDGECEFVFKNSGKEPLVLTNVRASCGCTTPSWTKEPVKKNKKGSVKVKYNTAIVGNFTKSITVYSNADNSPVRLTIKGKVVKDAAAK
jgi:hypothetical protein